MRRWNITVLVLLVIATAAWATGQQQSVQVRTGQLRTAPSFLGKIAAKVSYGDRLEILEERADWFRVRNASGASGWIHGSALTEKKVVLKAGQSDLSADASGEELALAGKGFNDEVEATWRSSNPDLDFSWVDRMENWTVDAAEIQDFLKQGSVQAGGE